MMPTILCMQCCCGQIPDTRKSNDPPRLSSDALYLYSYRFIVVETCLLLGIHIDRKLTLLNADAGKRRRKGRKKIEETAHQSHVPFNKLVQSYRDSPQVVNDSYGQTTFLFFHFCSLAPSFYSPSMRFRRTLTLTTPPMPYAGIILHRRAATLIAQFLYT